MKKLILCIIAFIMVFSLCACGEEKSVPMKDGMKVAGKDAGNEVVPYSFLFPKDWEQIRDDGVIELRYDCNKGASTIHYATITASHFDNQGKTALAYWDYLKPQLEELYVVKNENGEFVTTFKQLDLERYEKTATADNAIDGTPAIKVKYSGTKNSTTYICEQLICVRYNTVYLVTLTVPEVYYNDVAPAFIAVKDSIIFQD